jgi:hypothetical protein
LIDLRIALARVLCMQPEVQRCAHRERQAPDHVEAANRTASKIFA